MQTIPHRLDPFLGLELNTRGSLDLLRGPKTPLEVRIDQVYPPPKKKNKNMHVFL